MLGTAVLRGSYRYSLTRAWGTGPTLAWGMLNPSTADADEDDPSVRRCIGFSKSWGYGALILVNLFALKATNPKELRLVDDPIGPDNFLFLERAFRDHDMIAAWGAHGAYLDQGQHWLDRIRIVQKGGPFTAHCLGVTKGGQPKHPLYLPKTTQRVILEPADD